MISLYAKGMSTGDIQQHLSEIYGTDVSRETISKITDEIVGDMQAWQNRPLDPVYPVLVTDAIVIKVRDSQVANRPVYVVRPSHMPRTSWMTMLTDFRNRGTSMR